MKFDFRHLRRRPRILGFHVKTAQRRIDGMLQKLPYLRRRRLDGYAHWRHSRDTEETDLTQDVELMLAADMLSLSPALARKLHLLCAALNKPVATTLQDIVRESLRTMPARQRDELSLPTLRVERSAVIDQVFAELVDKQGRHFFGYRSDSGHVRKYTLLEEVLPETVTAETFQLAVEVEQRYASLNPPPFFPPPGGVVIEGGCYIGLKAMKWADWLGDHGKVIAVEIEAMNQALLARNIEQNGLQNVIQAVHAGIWSEDGTGTNRHSTGRRNFLHSTDEWQKDETHTSQVRTLTLDTIIDQSDVETVDYVNIQVNGAEMQALEGLKRRIDDVKVLYIAAYYTSDGVPNRDLVRQWASQRDWKIGTEGKLGNFTLINPKWAGKVQHYAPEYPQNSLRAA